MTSVSSHPRASSPAPAGAPDAGGAIADAGVLARGGTLALIGVVISGVLQLLLVVAVTRGLGAGAAGVFFLAIAVFMLLTRVADLGASTGLVRTVARLRALGRTMDLRRTLTIAVIPVGAVGVLLGLVLYALAGDLSAVIFDAGHKPEGERVIALLAPFVPLAAAATVALAATRGFGKMLPYVLVQNIALPGLRLLLVLGVIAAGLGSVAAGIAWAVPAALAAAAGTLWLTVLARRAARRPANHPPHPTRDLAVRFWRFSAPRGLAGVLGMAVTWMDVLLVGALRSTREAAIYAAASRLAIVGAYALQGIGMAIAPRISALLARGQGERVQRLYRTATWWVMALVWPVYAAMAVFAPFVMGIFGPEFVAGQTALIVLCLAMLVNLATGNVTTVLLMGGRSSWNLFNAAGSLAINVGLNLLLTPRLGINGAAIAWAASLVFVNVAPVVQVRFYMGLRPPFGDGFIVVAGAAGVCYGALGLAIGQGFGMSVATFVAYASAATALYLAVLWHFRKMLELPDLFGALRGPDSGPPSTLKPAPHAGTE